MRIRIARPLTIVTLLLAAAVAAAQGQQGPPPAGARPAGGGRPSGPPLQITSSAYSDGGSIPDKYTCVVGGFGSGASPAVTWANAPAGTASFILLFHDPDAHARKSLDDITHWIIYNIPGDSTGLPEGVKADAPATVGVQGNNVMGRAGYLGPCPPPGPPHHYTLELLALDTKLDVPASASRDDVLKAADGHVLTGTVYIGLFQRNPPPK
jgi:Raf kinase inhibitor-like YbhB/YbcL family protein